MVSKKHSSERKNYESPLCIQETFSEVPSRPFHEMNAIARGVEAKLDLLTGRSEIVTQGTIDIGRELGIPDEEIQKWASLRLTHDYERNGVITGVTKMA